MGKLKAFWKLCRKKMTKRWKIMTAYQVITFILSLILVYSVADYAITKSYRARKLELRNSFTVTAHTGSMDTKENSLESIEQAIKIGADVVEFDVSFDSSGTPVMNHSSSSITGKNVKVEEAFKLLVKDSVDISVNLDIKSTKNLAELENLVYRYGLEKRAFLTGVSEELVGEVRKQCPKLKYYLNCSPSRTKIIGEKYQQKLIAKLKETGAVGVNCNYIFSGQRLADLLHENGYLLSVWTVNEKDEMARSLVNGADNITSRKPDVLIELIDNWGS